MAKTSEIVCSQFLLNEKKFLLCCWYFSSFLQLVNSWANTLMLLLHNQNMCDDADLPAVHDRSAKRLLHKYMMRFWVVNDVH